MAIVAGTFQSGTAVGNREELSDMVSMITPKDTPFLTAMRETMAKTTNPEWETDELAAPADNAQLEGDEYAFAAISPVNRMQNHTQIFRKAFIIADTQEAIDNAGMWEKTMRQKLKRGVEIRKDVEFALVSANASASGNTRKLGSLATWYTSNVNRGSRGAGLGYNSSTNLTRSPTDGTQRAFTKALLDSVMQSCYTSGANVKYIVTSPYVKSVFVSFMSDTNVAAFRTQVKNGMNNTLVADADVYAGPYGEVMIKPNRVMSTAATSRNVHLFDPSMTEFKWLRKIHEDTEVAKTGDATKTVIIGEGTLCVKNEKGLGVIADVFGLTSTT